MTVKLNDKAIKDLSKIDKQEALKRFPQSSKFQKTY